MDFGRTLTNFHRPDRILVQSGQDYRCEFQAGIKKTTFSESRKGGPGHLVSFLLLSQISIPAFVINNRIQICFIKALLNLDELDDQEIPHPTNHPIPPHTMHIA